MKHKELKGITLFFTVIFAALTLFLLPVKADIIDDAEEFIIGTTVSEDFTNVQHYSKYYKMNLEKSGIYSFSSNIANNDSDILDSSGNRVSGFGNVCLLKGNYYIHVVFHDLRSAVTGTITLKGEALDPDIAYQSCEESYEDDNSRNEVKSKASILTAGKKYYGGLGQCNGADWYKLELNGEATVIISAKTYRGTIDNYILYNEDLSKEIMKIFWYGGTIKEVTIPAGVYYICASGGEVNSYSIEISNPEITVYNVKFDTSGGTIIPDVQVTEGTKLTAPTDPTKENCTFAGWYKDSALTQLWDFDTDVVTVDMTLYAKWVADKYTVKFESNGGSAVSSQTIEANGKVIKPADPTKAGYTFVGWYKDSALTQPWNFSSDVVNADITLYAKWDTPATEYTITVSPTSATIEVGQTVTLKATTSPSGSTVVWSSSNKNVATVNNGVVTGVSAGSAVITATANGVSATATINVVDNVIYPDRTISVGKKTTLKTNKKIKSFSVSPQGIVKVSKKGKKLVVKGKSAGVVSVIAYGKKNKFLGSWVIAVE